MRFISILIFALMVVSSKTFGDTMVQADDEANLQYNSSAEISQKMAIETLNYHNDIQMFSKFYLDNAANINLCPDLLLIAKNSAPYDLSKYDRPEGSVPIVQETPVFFSANDSQTSKSEHNDARDGNEGFSSSLKTFIKTAPMTIAIPTLGLGLAGGAFYFFHPEHKPFKIDTVPEIDKTVTFQASPALTAVGHYGVYPLLVTPYLFFFIVKPKDHWYKMFVYTEALSASVGLYGFASGLVDRMRPDGTENLSFYSGHVSTAFVWAGFMSRELAIECTSTFGKILSFTIPYSVAAVIAASRLGAQRHYFTDILVGFAIGTLLSNVLYAIHFDSNGNYRFKADEEGNNISTAFFITPIISIEDKYYGAAAGVTLRF